MRGRKALLVALGALVCGAVSPALPAAAKDPTPPQLIEAYQKEYAFLTAQKRALAARLLQAQAEQARLLASAQADVNGLQARIVLLRSKAEERGETLADVKRKGEGQGEDDRVTEIIDRARDSLGRLGLKVDTVAKDDPARQREALRGVFRLAAVAVQRANQVRVERGAFFLPSGKRVSGTLVRIGSVAAYGVSNEAAGALAPAGQGRLKLWPVDAAVTARALASGKRPKVLPMFLFETLEKNIEPKTKPSFFEEVALGGKIAWVIVGIGAVAILLILARVLILLIAGFGTDRLLKRLRPLLQAANLEEARRVAGRSWGSSGRVLQTTLAHAEAEREVIEDAVAEAVLRETPRVERFSAAITVFAAVAPLLGLLGTVTGMMATFDVITEHGTGDPKLLAGGISEALITTKLGLMVAIPTLLVGTLLRGWAEAIQVNMERAALHVINLWKGEALPAQTPPTGSAPTSEGPVPDPAPTSTAVARPSTPPALAEEPS